MKHLTRLWSHLFGPEPTTFFLTTSTNAFSWMNPSDSNVQTVVTSLCFSGREVLAQPLPPIAPGGHFSIDLGPSIQQSDITMTWLET